MSSSSALERTINKVLSQAEADLISSIDSAYHDSVTNIDTSRSKLEYEYNAIIESAKKQSENLKRQITGSTRLSSRNKQLILIENAVNTAFEKAKSQLASAERGEMYRKLVITMLEDGISAVGTQDLIVECSKNDIELVKNVIGEISKKNKVTIKVSEKPLSAIGGIRLQSADGSMTFDNTLDSRIERLKPLIRKNIAQMLRGDNQIGS